MHVQIDEARKELEKLKARKEEKDRQLGEAEQKAAEHAQLQALLAVQDLEAAEKMLQDILTVCSSLLLSSFFFLPSRPRDSPFLRS